jgi:hypothetical protein
MAKWEFDTKLVRPEGVGTWTFAPIPIDVAKQTGIKARLRVRGAIDGTPFQGTLLPGGKGDHFVVVKKELREKIGKSAGDIVHITMDLDQTPVTVEVPHDFAAALAKNSQSKAHFEKIAPSHKKAYLQWIESARQDVTRQKRIAKAVSMLSKGETL